MHVEALAHADGGDDAHVIAALMPILLGTDAGSIRRPCWLMQH